MGLKALILSMILALGSLAGGVGRAWAQDAEATDETAPAEERLPPPETNERRVQRLGDTAVAEEWEPDLSVPQPISRYANATAVLPDDELNAEFQTALNRLRQDPFDTTALTAMDEILAESIREANAAISNYQMATATAYLDAVREINPNHPGLRPAAARMSAARDVEARLAAAETAIEAGQLVEPEDGSALQIYRDVLAEEADNEAAQRGLLAVQQALIQRSLDSARELDFEAAEATLEQAAQVREPQELVIEAREQIAQYRLNHASDLETQALLAMEADDFDGAEMLIIDLIALGGADATVDELQRRLDAARSYGGYKPGQVIRDEMATPGLQAPAMVIIPAGDFQMGTPSGEDGRGDNEGPRHRVRFDRGFALGQHEVSVAEFQAFVEATGYRTEAERVGESPAWDDGSGRIEDERGVHWREDYEGRQAEPDEPVLHVTWNDAVAYTAWLSRETGEYYRLPSEAEWEYAIRAGSQAPYWWGDGTPDRLIENITGEADVSRGRRQWSVFFEGYDDGYWGPAPVGSFEPNPFGLYDMAGNVSEWTDDCWHDTYAQAPDDGRAWINPGCQNRVVRGGYWAGSPDQCRSGFRISAPALAHTARIGFRVARDL